MAKKRKRVPEVLWRLFHNRARTLADTVISLIPPSPPPAECRCKGRRCLGCSGQGYMSFLLRPDDPSEYRKLLTHCFVVVSDNAPPLSTFRPDCRWSQDELLWAEDTVLFAKRAPGLTRNCGIKSHQESLSGEATLCTGTDNANTEGNTNGEHQECSNQITAKSRKRLRQFSWQRHRKRRQLDIQETYSSTQCTRTMSDRERPSERPQSGLNTSGVTERGKQDVFYYRKSIWKKVMNLNDQNYRPLNDASVRNIIGKRSFGFSRVRLRPKGNGVRVLANLKASSRMPVKEHSLKVLSCGLLGKLSLHPRHVKYDTFKSVNNVLRDLHAFLKGLQMKKPEKLGSSVFDYDDVYRKLCPFLSVLKNGSTTVPSVFIVVCDVSKAFDSVNQDKLLSVMKDVIENDECLLKLSHQVVCTKKSLWVRQNIILADQDISIGSTKFTSASYHSLHGILVNQGWSRKIRKEELYFNLNEHVKQNVLQLDKKYYLQHVGIPQGSVLSSLLCSFYYGHLETNVILPFLEKNPEPSTGYMSERHDDYDASAEAARFFSRLQRGFREYNCYMNQEKCGLNFDIDQKSGITSNRVHMGDDDSTAKSYIGIIEGSLRYMRKLIKKRMHSMDVDSTFRPIFQVEKGEVEWLGLVAYIQVLKRKQSRYKELLSLLRARLIAQEKAKCVSSILKDAVDDSRSSVMWKIMY
ncbi:hypothetical protein HYC85_008892 [Camellia sinensis]|uniref:Telomerase reverse transcriptase n=1 Tax=Camellia sinensis TaxID=4442 RepID=A0A7J7HVE1_CAMSI|nr:hypothetical protein HYC85_008892 [Camellia sinensis]